MKTTIHCQISLKIKSKTKSHTTNGQPLKVLGNEHIVSHVIFEDLGTWIQIL